MEMEWEKMIQWNEEIMIPTNIENVWSLFGACLEMTSIKESCLMWLNENP